MTVRRDNRAKQPLNINEMSEKVSEILEDIQKNMFQKALDFRQENSHSVDSYDEFKDVLKKKGGFIAAHWDGTRETAEKIQSETKATIRVLPESEAGQEGKCILTGNSSKQRALFAVAY